MQGRVRTPIPSDPLQPEHCFAVVPAVAHVLPAGGLSYPAASCAFSRRRLDLDTQGSGERATQFGGTSSASQLRSGPHFSEVVADFSQATAVSSYPRENLLHNARLFGHRLKSRLTSTLANGDVTIPEWSVRHHVERTTLGRMLFATPAPLHDLGSLIFGDDALHLQRQVILWTLAERPI